MNRAYKILPWLIFAFAAVKILATVRTSPLIAYANNWDFARESGCYGVWEHYTNQKNKTAANFEGPVNPLVYDGDRHPGWCVYAIDNIFIRSVLAFHNFGDEIDLRTVGTLKAIFLLGMMSWLMVLSRKKSHQLVAALTFLLVFGDIAYLSFFNTLYAEFSMLAGAFLSLFGLLMLAYDAGLRRSSIAFCIISLLFFGLAKAQYMPLAVVAGVMMGIVMLMRHKAVTSGIVLIAVTLAMPIGFNVANPPTSGIMRTISLINIVDTVMVAVLPSTRDPLASMRKIGLPEHCSKGLGVSWYSTRVGNATYPPCPEVAKLSRTKLIGLFLRNPTSFFRPMSLGISRIRPLQLTYLPNTENALVRNSKRYRFLESTSLSSGLDKLGPPAFFFLVIAALATGVTSLLVIRQSSPAFLCSAGGTLIFYALFSSVFGDGFHEISKHGTAIFLGICVQAVGCLFYLAAKLRIHAKFSNAGGGKPA
jgi:hypothetical protein